MAAGTDADPGTTLSYALGGMDAAKFVINASTGAVTFVTAPNFEAPTDAGGNNVYDITVTANDGVNTSVARAVAIMVTNVNDNTPVIGSVATTSFAENGTRNAYVVSATDADADPGATLTYAMSGVDSSLFNINASTGAVTFKVAPNYEVPTDVGADNVYNISVTANDGVNTSAAQAVAITVTNVVIEGGEPVIDLGSYGKLIAPVQVDGGHWFYYWDRSGDGTSADTGSLNAGDDRSQLSWLKYIFNQDINGNVQYPLAPNPAGNAEFRYCTLNGVHLALPNIGGADPTPASSPSNFQLDATAIGSGVLGAGSNETNTRYSDLSGVWDAYNGTGAWDAMNGVNGTANGTTVGWHYVGQIFNGIKSVYVDYATADSTTTYSHNPYNSTVAGCGESRFFKGATFCSGELGVLVASRGPLSGSHFGGREGIQRTNLEAQFQGRRR